MSKRIFGYASKLLPLATHHQGLWSKKQGWAQKNTRYEILKVLSRSTPGDFFMQTMQAQCNAAQTLFFVEQDDTFAKGSSESKTDKKNAYAF